MRNSFHKYKAIFSLLLICLMMLAQPASAQFRTAAGREDFQLLEKLGEADNKEAYERQFQTVVAAAQKRGDDYCLFDAYGVKAVHYLKMSDVKTNAVVLAQMKKLAENRQSDYGMMGYCLARAMSLTAQMLPEEAMKELDEAIAICNRHPGDEHFNSSYAYSQKGQAYLIYPKYDEAIAEIETAVAKAGSNKQFQRNPRISLFRLYVANDEHLKEAKEHMDWLLENFPQEEMNHYEKETFQFSSVLYYLYLNDAVSAQKVVNQMEYNIIRFDCQRRVYECNKDYSRAIEAFEQYIEKNDSVVASLVEKQMIHYNSELDARQLDVRNARLEQANHLLELEQNQSARRILQLEQEGQNQRLQTLSRQLELDRQQQEMENLQLEKSRNEARIQQEQSQARNRVMKYVVIILAVFMVLGIIFFLMILHAIRALRRQKKIAVEATRHAEEANLMKSRFLQNMNHDLRAPLAAIVSIVDLQNTPGIEMNQEEKAELLDGLKMQSDLLLQLVDDIIDLSALQSGEYHLDSAEVNLRKLCTNAIMGFKRRCAEGVEMKVELPEGDIVLKTDYKRLLEVIGNLLGNAAKYTEKGSIVLSYEVREQEVEFAVTDTGTGIPESQAANIFDRFEKIGSVKKGFGLGLSICQSVVTLMKGRIWLDTAYKQGARFCFTVPRLVALLCLLGVHQVQAQDNPYHIDNEAYSYMLKYTAHQTTPDAVRYVDSLMTRVQNIHDLKGQCIGLNLYTDHLYVTNADIHLLRQANERCIAFCRKTPYVQYVFSSWNFLIQRLLNDNQYMQVLHELEKYQEMAMELKSVYGRSNGLMYLGRTYVKLKQYQRADQAYRDAIQYVQSSGDTTSISSLYQGYGSCLVEMKKYRQALSAYKAGSKACRLPHLALSLLLDEANCYYGLKDAEEMGYALERFKEQSRRQGLSPVLKLAYQNLLAKYYVLRGDADSAQQLMDGIQSENVNAELRRDLLLLKGDMSGAFQHMVAECQKHGEENQRILGTQFQEFNVSMRNSEKELELERLKLNNTEMLLENARQARQLLALENEGDSLRILDAQVSLQTHDAERRLLHQQEADNMAAHQLEAAKEKHIFRLNAILAGVLLLCFVIILFGLYRLWKVRKAIVRERKVAFEAQHAAEQADDDMSLFMHAMNHEIRTPLNSIIGFSELLNQSDEFGLSDEERNCLVDSLHEHTQSIQQLVNTILDMSKMESGTYVFHPEPTMLYVLAEQALEPLRSQVGAEVKIVNKVDLDETVYLLDNNRIGVLLSRLLQNAVQFTHQGSISLDMKYADGRLRIDVEDTGEGIPEAVQSRIFERFSKADSFSKGFGLGLPLCKVIVDKMDGTIRLEKSSHLGTHFVVEIPCERETSNQII